VAGGYQNRVFAEMGTITGGESNTVDVDHRAAIVLGGKGAASTKVLSVTTGPTP